MSTRRRPGGTFGWPGALAATSLAALIVGLLGDGWQDGVAWAGLAAPVIAAGRAWRRRG